MVSEVAAPSPLPGQLPLGFSHMQPQAKSANSLIGLVRYGDGKYGKLPLMASLAAAALLLRTAPLAAECGLQRRVISPDEAR